MEYLALCSDFDPCKSNPAYQPRWWKALFAGNDGNPSDGSAPTRVQQHVKQQSPENGNMCGSLRMQFHPTSRNRNINRHGNAREAFHDLHACLCECGTATEIDCANLRLTMLPEIMQTRFQPTWLLIVLQWTDCCRAAHRTRSSCWITSKLMGMTVLVIFALMHRRLKAKFYHLKFKAYLTLINRGWRRSGNLLYPPRNHSSCCATIARGAIIMKICTDPMLMRTVQGRQSFATISNRSDHGSESAGPNGEVFNLDESDMSENLMQLF